MIILLILAHLFDYLIVKSLSVKLFNDVIQHLFIDNLVVNLSTTNKNEIIE